MSLPDWLRDPARLPGLPPLRGVDLTVQAWLWPTFSPAASWSFYAGPRAARVRRVVAFPNPVGGAIEPWGADALVPLERVSAALAALAALRLPPFPSRAPLGRDGTSYGVAAGSATAGAALTWWEAPPPGWEPLADLHRELVSAAEAALPPFRGPAGAEPAHDHAIRSLLSG